MNGDFFVSGHRLRLLRNGEEYFPRLIAAIDAAVRSVYLETYIYEADESGRRMAETLKRATARGVAVHLLLDGYGSADLPASWVEELRAAGVEVLWYRPQISWVTLRLQRLRRMHRKQAVIDGQIAFVGGINIINDNSDDMTKPPRLDFAVELEGETAERIHVSMRRLWLMVVWSSFRKPRDREKMRLRLPQPTQDGVNFVFRDNLRHRHDIEHAYLKAIAGASHEIILATAYFIPGRNFRLALLHAARRGVRVALMLPGLSDHPWVGYTTRALYDELLAAGVEIYEYRSTFMHAKVGVVDGHWATVGSSNIDPLSFLMSREGNIVVRDEGFAGVLREFLVREMERGSLLVLHAAWLRKGFLSKLLPRMIYALIRFSVSFFGHPGRRDDM